MWAPAGDSRRVDDELLRDRPIRTRGDEAEREKGRTRDAQLADRHEWTETTETVVALALGSEREEVANIGDEVRVPRIRGRS